MPMFSIKRPTPTTVLYTVSTRAGNASLSSSIQRSTYIALRFLIGILVSLVLFNKVQTSTIWLPNVTTSIDGTALGTAVETINTKLALPWLLAVSIVLFALILRKGYTEESLLVIRGLGVQTSTSSPTYLSTAATRFIPTHLIQDIFIHEAFKGFEVKFYLAIVVEGEDDVVVVFPSVLPKRQMLEEVWRGARACLYEPRK